MFLSGFRILQDSMGATYENEGPIPWYRTEQAIFYNGGRMFEKDGEVWYSIPIDY